MRDVNRVQFDATLEEIADVYMRVASDTNVYRDGRRQSQWTSGVIVAGVLAVMLQQHISPVGTAVFSALSGFLCGFLYGGFYDRWVKYSYLRWANELYGGVSTVPCAFELRGDVFWGKTGNIEVAFPWSDGVSVNDRGDCIEVWCHPTVAVVRNRAFHSDSERQAFLQAARSKSL
jgi:hypothetical protein